MLDARDRILQRAVRIVEVRGAFEAGETFGGGRVVVVIRVELAAQFAEPLLELLRIDVQTPGQAEEREVVAMATKRQDPAALRAEMLVERGARAAAAAFEHRRGT